MLNLALTMFNRWRQWATGLLFDTDAVRFDDITHSWDEA